MASRRMKVKYVADGMTITTADVDALASFVYAGETLGLSFRDKFVTEKSLDDWPRPLVSATFQFPPTPEGVSAFVDLDGGDLGRGTKWQLNLRESEGPQGVLSVETADQVALIRFLFAARRLGFEHWLWDHFGMMTMPIYGASGGFGIGVMSYLFFPREIEAEPANTSETA